MALTLDGADVGPIGSATTTRTFGGGGLEALLPIHVDNFALVTTATVESLTGFVDGSGRDTSWNWTIVLLPWPRHYRYH